MDYSGPAYKTGEAIWSWSFLNWYSILMTVAFISVFISILIQWKKNKYPVQILQMMLIIIVPCSLLGARLWTVVVYDNWDFSNFFTFAGLSIQGGVFGGALGGFTYAYTKRSYIDLRTAAGLILANVLLGQAIGRWGNFTNHEVYGRALGSLASDAPLKWLPYISKHMFITDLEGVTEFRVPLFFYESLINFAGWFLIAVVLIPNNRVKPGTPAALYFLWYGITRISFEGLRTDENVGTYVVAGLSIFFGLFLLIWFEIFTKPYFRWAKKIKLIPDNLFESEYVLIKPKKEVKKLFGKGTKMKTYRIWLPANNGKIIKKLIMKD